MLRWSIVSTTVLATFTGAVLAQPAVTLTLDSPQAGQVVAPGTEIEWTILFSVSAGDNQGLALLSCDLVQSGDNPALLDVPPADGVPAEMANFSRPAGVSNPGETDPVTGYIGVQRGETGAMNLIQIGGGQNTFGEALPAGSGIAESADVVAGVGQGAPGVLASGTLPAPSACGAYTFELANAVANVLEQVNQPPDFSPVLEALVDTEAGSLSVSVGLNGDLDLDGDVDLADLSVLLSNYGTLSGADYADGDLDGDGDVDLADLSVLLAAYGSSC
jgi:hypothetical protein